MIRADLVVVDAAQLVTLKGPAPRTGAQLSDLAILPGGCLAAHRGRVVFVGTREQFEAEVVLDDACEVMDASGQAVLPGFVDPHTHLPFAGSREEEFSRRLAGATYQEIAAGGGGILSTVRATRAASDEDLLDAMLERLDRMLIEGITTCEAKSGYGLTVADELRLLRLIKEAGREHPVTIVPTLLGAHTVPEEHRGDRERYIRLVIEEMIPVVAKEGLAVYCDAFCEKGVFTVEEARRILEAGLAHGLQPRLHADQLTSFGGAELAADLAAASADHLEHVSDAGLARMAAAGVAGIILPGAALCMREKTIVDARRLIAAGVAPAIATDLNPGTSNTESMSLMIALAVLRHGMTVEEAIAAATLNAAVTIGRDGLAGSLEVGKAADMILLDAPSCLHLAYRPGVNLVDTVIKEGRVVVRGGRLDREDPEEPAS